MFLKKGVYQEEGIKKRRGVDTPFCTMKACKPDNSESHNYLKLSSMNL